MQKLLFTAVFLIASTFAYPQLPANAPATNLFEGIAFKNYDKKSAAIPAGTKQLKFEITITDQNFERMPLGGYEEGVWISFLNDADEVLDNSGKVAKAHLGGFGMGVNVKSPKAKTMSKTVAVPPGATKVQLKMMQWAGGMPVSGSRPSYTVDKVVVTPL